LKAFESKTAEQMTKWLNDWILAIKNNSVSGFALSKNLTKNIYCAKEFEVKKIYDNNSELHNKTIDSFFISSPAEIKQGEKIVIFSDIGYINIKYILQSKGLTEFYDFILWRNLLPVLKWVKKQELFIPECHTAVTTKCSLNCTKCNMLIPKHRQENTDEFVELSKLKNDADLFFGIADYCEEFQILGGEPLLHPDFKDYLEYLLKYRKKINKLQIVTNGTIIPNQEILQICNYYNISFTISNYTLSDISNYAAKRNEVLQIIGQNNLIMADAPIAISWSDFFKKGERSVEHYQRCSPVFKGLNDGKFYSCHLVWSADKCNFVKANEDDYLDLSKIKSDINGKLELLKFNLGFHKTGFLNLCKVCGGCDPYFFNPIKAGEQLKISQ
jgi:organic radical activating enzyme